MSTEAIQHGLSVSKPEITHISEHGFWLLVNGAEYFVPFEKFPWFRDAKESQIREVELLHGSHLYWPALDVDLSLAIIEQPENYPLVSKVLPQTREVASRG